MYHRDQSLIAKFAQTDAKSMQRVITFVYCTVQQSLLQVPSAMLDIDVNGVESRFLWGWKADAYLYVSEHREEIYETLMATWRGYADETVAATETLRYLVSLPGLGLVKAGFVNQLIFGHTGCIDGHNHIVYEIKPYRFQSSAYKRGSPKLKRRMLADYVSLCWDIGGSEFLWNNWCKLVGKNNNMTADAVSALHVRAII